MLCSLLEVYRRFRGTCHPIFCWRQQFPLKSRRHISEGCNFQSDGSHNLRYHTHVSPLIWETIFTITSNYYNYIEGKFFGPERKKFNHLNTKKWKYLSIQCPPISKRVLLFERFPGFAHLSFWYCAICRWMWVWSIGGMILGGETQVLGGKAVPVPICPPEILLVGIEPESSRLG
jgi:hypothetical protein